jgi:hypothetical protein
VSSSTVLDCCRPYRTTRPSFFWESYSLLFTSTATPCENVFEANTCWKGHSDAALTLWDCCSSQIWLTNCGAREFIFHFVLLFPLIFRTGLGHGRFFPQLFCISLQRKCGIYRLYGTKNLPIA